MNINDKFDMNYLSMNHARIDVLLPIILNLSILFLIYYYYASIKKIIRQGQLNHWTIV